MISSRDVYPMIRRTGRFYFQRMLRFLIFFRKCFLSNCCREDSFLLSPPFGNLLLTVSSRDVYPMIRSWTGRFYFQGMLRFLIFFWKCFLSNCCREDSFLLSPPFGNVLNLLLTVLYPMIRSWTGRFYFQGMFSRFLIFFRKRFLSNCCREDSSLLSPPFGNVLNFFLTVLERCLSDDKKLDRVDFIFNGCSLNFFLND